MIKTISAVAAAVALATVALPASAEPAEAVRNIVLVHGAFADGSGWRGVYDELTTRLPRQHRSKPAHLL